VEVWTGFIWLISTNSEHGAAISPYILQKKSPWFWTFFCISG